VAVGLISRARPWRRIKENNMTLAQRFIQKARVLVPEQEDLQSIDPALDDPQAIDDVIFRRSEYLGGMAAVILALIASEGGKQDS